MIEFILMLLVANSAPAFAGACIGDSATYLNDLARANPDQRQSSIECLYWNVVYLDMGYDGFASPTAIAKVHEDNSPLKEMAFRTLPRFLTSKNAANRCHAAGALAYFQWKDSYDNLQHCLDDAPTRKAILYAILGDKRAASWIIAQYDKLDARYRKHPIQSRAAKMTYLNALYHLAAPESLSFIDGVIAAPRPASVKDRALQVKHRINEVNQQK